MLNTILCKKYDLWLYSYILLTHTLPHLLIHNQMPHNEAMVSKGQRWSLKILMELKNPCFLVNTCLKKRQEKRKTQEEKGGGMLLHWDFIVKE